MSVSSDPSNSTHIGVWRMRLNNVWQRITEPHPAIWESEKRRARMLSSLLVTLIGIGVLEATIAFVIEGVSSNFWTIASGTVALLIIHRLSQSRHYRMAAIAAVVVIFISVGSIMTNANQILRLDFLVLGILVGSLFFSTRQTIILSLVTVAALFALGLFVPGLVLKQIIPVVFLVGSASILSILGTSMNRRDLAQIEEQAHMLANEIEERKQVEAALRQQTAYASALVRTATRINVELELDAVLKVVCEESARGLGLSFATVSLLDKAHQRVQLTAAYGLSDVYFEKLKAVQPTSLAAYSPSASPVLVTPDVQALPDLLNADLYMEMNLRSTASVMMSYRGQLIGRLNVGVIGEVRDFSDDELVLLQGLAAQGAQAISNAQLHRQQLQTEEVARGYLEKITEQTPGALFEFQFTPEGMMSFPFVSPSIADIHPSLTAEMLKRDGSLVFSTIHPDDVEMIKASVQASHETLVNWDVEFRVAADDGIRWHRGNAKPEKQPDGTVIWYGIFQDITDRKQVEDGLQKSEERFRQLADNIRDVFWMTDVWKPQVLYVSQAYEEVWGRSRADIYRDPTEWIQAILPDDRGLASAAFDRQLQGKATDTEYRIQKPDGSIVWIRDRSFPVRNSEGEIYRIAGIAQDITEYRQTVQALRESQERYQSLFENVPIALGVADMQGNILAYNKAMVAQVALTDEDEGRQFTLEDAYAHPRERAALLRTLREQGFVEKHEVEIRRVNGTTYPAHISIRPITWANQPATLAMIEDISERKQAQAERIGRQIAEQANTAKSEFLSRMSHELRTPMNSILGFAQLLEMSQKEPLSSTQQSRVEQILKAGRHLLDLINQVLDISRVESGRLDISLEAVDVAAVATAVLDLAVPLATERRIRVHGEVDLKQATYVTADQQRLKQVMINLLANAIKYNKEGGEVWLACESRPDGWQRISVRDTGPGIPPEQQEKLFQPFERLGAEQRDEVEGTGLGLALSKRLVELMGGRIGVESGVGAGSTFWVELPGAEHPANGMTPPLAARPLPAIYGQNQTILYIEDNLANYELVAQVLAEEVQAKLVWAIQGSIGLELARQHLPDLILLDLNLPDMHGSEVLARLRQDETTAAIPVIVISADATPHQIERLKDAGADGYLTKPLNVAEFLRTTQALLTRN